MFAGDVIAAYTREQAIEDGVLVDVTPQATEEILGGFPDGIHVCVTNTVWGLIADIPPRRQGFDDVRGRLHDVLWMGRLAFRRAYAGGEVRAVYRVILPHGRKKHATLEVVATIEPVGDNPEQACITIQVPGED